MESLKNIGKILCSHVYFQFPFFAHVVYHIDDMDHDLHFHMG